MSVVWVCQADILNSSPTCHHWLQPLPGAPCEALAGGGGFPLAPRKGQLCRFTAGAPQGGLPMRLEQFIADYGFEN